MIANTYRALTGRVYDLTDLAAEEREFLGELIELYERSPPWFEFTETFMNACHRKKVPVDHPVFEICQDLDGRLGIAQGCMARPDYRAHLVDLIEERFPSRRDFCQKTGIDEGHLSRVIQGNSHFSTETLSKVLEALGVEMVFREGDDHYLRLAARHPLEPASPFERLTEVQQRLDRLTNLTTRARGASAAEKRALLRSRGRLVPDPFLDPLRARVESGASFDRVLEEATKAALAERARVARQLAREATQAEKAHRKAAS